MDILKNLQSLHLSDDKKSMEQHAPTPPPTAAPTTTHSAPKYENLLNKIGDVLEADHGSAPAPVVAAHPPSKREDSLFDKLGDALGGSKHTATPPAPPVAVSEQRTTDKLLSKLEEKLTGKQAPPPPPAPKREETLVDKISDKLTGHKTPPPPPKEAHLLDKLANVITGKEEHPKPHGIADKINNALGGGAKGEAQEDKLDKAIDFFQEHVLKQGDQSNESALEQAKDKQIADAIRQAVGRPKNPKS